MYRNDSVLTKTLQNDYSTFYLYFEKIKTKEVFIDGETKTIGVTFITITQARNTSAGINESRGKSFFSLKPMPSVFKI